MICFESSMEIKLAAVVLRHPAKIAAQSVCCRGLRIAISCISFADDVTAAECIVARRHGQDDQQFRASKQVKTLTVARVFRKVPISSSFKTYGNRYVLV